MEGADRDHFRRFAILKHDVKDFVSGVVDFPVRPECDSEKRIEVGISQITKLVVKNHPVEKRLRAPAEMPPEPEQRPVDDGKIGCKIDEAHAVDVARNVDSV